MNRIFALFILGAIGFSCAVPWLGVTFKKGTFENHLALQVIGVHPGSGCFTAGMVAGDQIVGVQGQPLQDVSQIQQAISNSKTGASIKVEILRDGKKMPLNVKLTDRPDDISSLTGSAIGSKMADFGANFYKNGEKRNAKPKATLLDFWATWCGPCRKTLPVLANVYNKYASQGLEVIGISNEDVKTLNAFYSSQHSSPYPLYRDASQEMWRRYGIHAVPTLMLLDENGYIKRVWSGAPSQALVEQLVVEVLKESKK
ncbi:MAG: redoxin domain-containing protein [Fibrobacter sp.]|nr:redoxin domain-containing protein [Fibrobacter sp.]